jgi:N-hydroxyarylamine O-acetyltransferase
MNATAQHDTNATTVPTSEWRSEQLDVDAYLERVGYDGDLKPTAETLRGLHRAHVAAIPFENLDIVLGRGISLEMDAMQDKLIRRDRGGYCYEHNLLFAALLERIGFAVSRLTARIRMGSNEPQPSGHMLLRVDAGGRPWLADVGFGGQRLLEPIPLEDGATARQGSWTYRLDYEGAGVWVLRVWRPDGWFDLYSFTLEPRHHGDYGVYNYYTSTNPDSPFVKGVVVLKTERHLRRSLTGRRFTTTYPDGSIERRELSGAELIGVLRSTFGIALEAGEEAGIRSTYDPDHEDGGLL